MTQVVDWLQRRAWLTPDKTALVDAADGRRISFNEWNRSANRTARFLSARANIGRGDRVAVLAGNCIEYLDIWFACQKLGAILQNLNWRLSVQELAQLLADAAPKVLIYGEEFRSVVRALRGGAASSSIDGFIALGAPDYSDDTAFAERDEHGGEFWQLPPLKPDDPWVICYTGGSTGLPKGVILTHANIAWNAANTVLSWGLSGDDSAILNAPLFHTGGLNVFTAPLVQAGGTSVVCKEFDPDQVFDLIATGQANLFFGVPTMFVALQNHPRWADADFSALKLVISGGAPCPQPVFERFWERGVDFKTGYGLTEAGPNNFWLPPEQVRSKPGAVGYPLLNVEVRLIDAEGAPITEPDTPGELLIRGAHRTPGYWNNPEATAAVIDPDGWLHTGDLASFDADGAYTIVGRRKDMFISGGENVYPAEVESVLQGHPAVAEVAVVGVPDDHWGEVGVAVVAKKPGAEVDDADLRAFVRERLAKYKVPKSVRFVDELPRTGPGKIDKQALREQLL